MRTKRSILCALLLLTCVLYSSGAFAAVRLVNPSYQPNEPITVIFENLPGNKQDWITLIPKGTPDNQYGEWFYTGGARSGRHTFAGKPAGQYEIRVYHNWPAGGYTVRERLSFSVAAQPQLPPPSSSQRLRSAKTSYQANEPIEIVFENFPGNKQDWITLIPKGAPDNQYGEWFYTGGARSGRHTFAGKPAGEYEVRAYFDWPKGGFTVRERLALSVKATAAAPSEREIFNNWNTARVVNNPSGPPTPTRFTLDRPHLVTYINTYHYFNQGQRPGTISLVHQDGTVYGPWQTIGLPGQGGVANASWEATPNVQLKPGTYTVRDSHPPTWSHNAQSNSQGSFS